MANFKITCPACGGLHNLNPPDDNILTIPFNYFVEGEIYAYNGEPVPKQVEKKIETGSIPEIAPFSISEFVNFFTPVLENGEDILHIDFSANYSNNVKYAKAAAKILTTEFPERKIEIIDSKRLGLGVFALAKESSGLLNSDFTLDEAAQTINNLSDNNVDLIITDNWTFLKRKKYISSIQKKFGELKGKKIILSFNAESQIIPICKTKSRDVFKEAFKIFGDNSLLPSEKYYTNRDSDFISNPLFSSILNAKDKKDNAVICNTQTSDIFTISKTGLNFSEILCFKKLS